MAISLSVKPVDADKPLKKIKPFDTNLELTMSNLAKGRIILKFNNSDLMQKNYSLYSNFIE